jgi:hypothetical protein
VHGKEEVNFKGMGAGKEDVRLLAKKTRTLVLVMIKVT